MKIPIRRDPIFKLMSLVLVLVLTASLFIVQIQITNVVQRFTDVVTLGMVGQAYAVEPDYKVDGVNDHVQVQQALDALPAAGGKLKLLGGTYDFAATVTRAIGEVTIEGMGMSTLINWNGADDLFDDGGQDNWLIQNIAVDAGSISLTGTDSQAQNIWIGGTFYTVWSGTTGTGTVVLPADSIDHTELSVSSTNAGTTVSIDDFLLGAAAGNQVPQWNGANWVPATIAGGGNGTDIYYGVISAPNGTNPFATGANETLTFISNDITITGMSGNDTIVLALGQASVKDNELAATSDNSGDTVSITDFLSAGPGVGQIPKWDGTNWNPAADDDTGGAGTDVYFGIFSVPNGTNPFVTGANETISFISDDIQMTGNSGNDTITWVVLDNSHAHTGATISNIDISADTNLSVGFPLSLAGNLLEVGNATTTALGVATFDPSFFAVTNGNVTFIGSAVVGNLTDIGDVTITGPVDGGGLYYNGSSWVNEASGSRSATFVVAANDSTQAGKDRADYVGNGTHDDVAIQAAIDALPTAGGTVVLLEGAYTLAATIDIDHNDDYITLAGVGKGTRLIKDFNGTMIAAGNGTSILWNITIRDMRLLGRGTSGKTGDAIVLTRVSRPIIENLEIDDVEQYGIHVQGSGTDYSTGPMIVNNNISDIGSHGIFIDSYVELPLIQANDIQRTVGDGILISTTTAYGRVFNNWIENAGANAINLHQTARTQVIGNKVNTSGEHGIRVHQGKHHILIGNIIEDASDDTANTYDGIYLNNLTFTVVTGNEVFKTGGNNIRYGISINHASSANNTVVDNTVEDYGTAAIYDEGVNTRIRNNVNHASDWGDISEDVAGTVVLDTTTEGDSAGVVSLHDFLTGSPTINQIPKWDGGNWTWSADGGAGNGTDIYFGIVAVPAGTNPYAASANETLTFISDDIVITGTAGNNTVTLALGTASVKDNELAATSDNSGNTVSITDFLTAGPGVGQIPKWDGTNWAPANDATAGAGNGTDFYWGLLDTPLGTDPFVAGANETLQFLNADGYFDITGNAEADSVTFALDATALAWDTEIGLEGVWLTGILTTGEAVETIGDCGAGVADCFVQDATATVTGNSLWWDGDTAADNFEMELTASNITADETQVLIPFSGNIVIDDYEIVNDIDGNGLTVIGNTLNVDLALGDLNNVDTTGVDNNKIIKYNNVAGGWIIADDEQGGGMGTDLYWGEVDTPNGTNPIVVGANETLSFRSDGLTITGLQGNDTVTFEYAENSIGDQHIDWGNGTNKVNANDILFEFLAGATYQTLQQWLTVDGSSGLLTGGAITSNGDGTASIAAGTGLIRTVNSETSPIVFFDFAGNASVPLVDNTANYIYIDYNSGNPRIRATTSQTILFDVTKPTFAGIFRDGNVLHVQNTVSQYADYVHRNNLRNFEVDGVIRTSGQVTSDNGNLTIAVTAGVMYAGIDRIITNAIDTGGGDTIDFYWTDDSGATWTTVNTQVLNNTQYNDITSGLVALTSNRYATLWIYVSYDGDEYHGLYGRDDYTLIQSEDAQPPTVVPNVIGQYANLVAKIIIQKNDTVMIIFTPFGTVFTGNFAENHNDLGALQGGTAGEYFHLTSSEHVELTGWIDNVTLGSSGALTLPTGQNFTIGSVQWNSGDNIDATKVANADLGDIGVAGGVWSVEDDSHEHTGSTVSGISVGNTSLEVGSPLTLTGDLLEIGNATTAALGAAMFDPSFFTVTDGNVTFIGSAVVGNLTDIGDVVVTGPVDGEGLYFDGPGWVNEASGSRSATFVVAANDSTQAGKDRADYVGNGTHDDVAIQAAIDALPANGGRVVLLEGIYSIATTIELGNNTVLEGQGSGVAGSPSTSGRNTVLFLANGANTTVVADTAGRTDYVQILNLSIDGNNANNGTGNGITLTEAYNAHIMGLKLQNLPEKGIELVGPASAIRVFNIQVRGCNEEALKIGSGITDIYVINNEFLTSEYGIQTSGGSSTFTNNHLGNNDKDGLYLFRSDKNVISNNYVNANEFRGIRITDSEWNIVTSNMIAKNGQASSNVYSGIHVTSSAVAQPAQYNLVANNNIFDTTGDRMKYCIEESVTGDGVINYNTYEGNILSDWVTASAILLGSNNITRNNQNYDVDWGDVSEVSGLVEIDAEVVTTVEIGNNTILANDLNATNAEADNDLMTYDVGTGGFTFETPEEIITAGTGLSWGNATTLNAAGGNGTDIYYGVMDTPLGTNPTAVGPNETLTFISNDLTITGTAGNDTIALAYAVDSLQLITHTLGQFVQTVLEGFGIDIVGGTGEGSSPLFIFDPTEVGTATWGNGSAVTYTYDASGGIDPVWTYGANESDLSTGQLKENGNRVLTTVSTLNIDISDDTNLLVQSPLTLTDDLMQVANATTTTLGVATFDPSFFSVANGNVTFIGSAVVGNLTDIGDVTIAGPADGDGVYYTGSGWANEASGSRSTTLVVAASDSSQAGKDRADYVCSGVDDQVEINAAISALPAQGGRITLLEGNFTTTAAIVLLDDVALEGQGSDSTTIITTTNAISVISATGNAGDQISNVYVARMSIRGWDITSAGLSLTYTKLSRFDDLHIYGFDNYGIYMLNSWDNTWVDIYVEWCGSTTDSEAAILLTNDAASATNNQYFYGLHVEPWRYRALQIDGAQGGGASLFNKFFGTKIHGNEGGNPGNADAIVVSGSSNIFVGTQIERIAANTAITVSQNAINNQFYQTVIMHNVGLGMDIDGFRTIVDGVQMVGGGTKEVDDGIQFTANAIDSSLSNVAMGELDGWGLTVGADRLRVTNFYYLGDEQGILLNASNCELTGVIIWADIDPGGVEAMEVTGDDNRIIGGYYDQGGGGTIDFAGGADDNTVTGTKVGAAITDAGANNVFRRIINQSSDWGEMTESSTGVVTLDITTAGNSTGVVSLHDFLTGAPALNQIPKWDGANWAWAADGGGGAGDMTKAVYDADTDNDIDLAAGGLGSPNGDPGFDAAMTWNDGNSTTEWKETYSLSDPNDDRFLAWFDSEGNVTMADPKPEELEFTGNMTLQLVPTGEFDFSGSKEFQIREGTDPDVAESGDLAEDNDDYALRAWYGNESAQAVMAMIPRLIPFTIVSPASLGNTSRPDQSVKIFHNATPFTLNLTYIFAESDDDDYEFYLYETASRTDFSMANDSLIDTITCATDGTDIYTDIQTTFTDGSIAPGACILFAHKSGTTTYVSGTIVGYLDADVP